MSGSARNGQTGPVFIAVGAVLGLVGFVVADGISAAIIYACAGAVVLLGLLMTVRDRRP